MKTPGSIFALTKAAQNRMFSEAIADKYENAGISPYVGVSLVFLNLKQNQILRENTKETIQIIYQLMLQWNNRQDFPLAGTTVFSHIRENIEYDLQTLRCENRELYRELNSIWQEIRVIDRREAAAAGKKRANRRQDYFQKERRKWNEKLETALTLVKQTAVQAPAELRPADVCKAIISRLDKRQSLQTEIREPGITGTKFLGQEALGTGTPGTEAETRLKNFSGRFTGFIYRDSFRELYRMLEHRMPGDEQRLPGETQRIIQQNQVLAGMQEVPAGLQTINRIVNQQVNRQINRQPLWTEELTHRIVESREAGILEVEFSGAKTLGTGTPGAEIPGINAPGTKAETRLKNLREIFTGFIYRDSFRELHRMLEHRLPGMERRQSGDEHRLPGETQRIMRQREALAGTQGIPAGTQEVPAGIQTINRIANQQISQQVNRQISRRLLRTTEELTHQITENREEGSPGTEFPGGKTLGTGIPWAEIPGINALRTETETRQISLSERFTGFLYHGSVRELHRMPEHRLPGMERRQSGDEHQPPGVERRLTGEIQRIVRQNEALAGTQGIPAGTQAVPAGIQTINRIANQQISQQINRQISQQVNRQINRRLLRTTEELTHRITENREAGGPGTGFPGEKTLGTGVPGAEIPGINALRTETETRLRSLSERFTGFLYHGSVRELHRMPEHRLPGMERRQSGDEHQPPGVERRLTGEIQRIVRQNEALAGTQGIPAGTQAVPAGIQTINRIANQQISQQINRQISQQVNRQINRRLLRTTEELTHRITENRKAGGPGTEFPGEKALGTGVPGAEVPGINALRTEAEIRLNRTIHTEYLDAQKRYFRIVRKELLPLEIKAARLEGLLGRGRPPRTNGRTRPDTGTIRDRQAETERLRHREAIRNKITVLDDIHLLKTISERQRTDGNGRKFSAAENFLRMRPALTAAQTLKTQAAAEAAQPLKYRTKGQSDRKAPGQEAFLDNLHTELQYLKKKEATGEEALREQKQNVKVLTEKINIQEQAIHQMKNAGQGQTSALGKAEVKMVADAVLERLQKDIHLQRLRMGMS
jgi:hypothetical protein